MKISAYHKSLGDTVILKTDYNDLDIFDKVYISKVFTDTEVPGEPDDKSQKNCENIAEWYANNEFLKQPNIEYGGTGFFYDKAPPLPDEIEHNDNFFSNPHWKELIEPVVKSGKRFQFKQGLDEKLLTKEKILEISKWKYDGEMIFAFDNIEDKDLIISKLKLIRETVPNWKRGLKFYVFLWL